MEKFHIPLLLALLAHLNPLGSVSVETMEDIQMHNHIEQIAAPFKAISKNQKMNFKKQLVLSAILCIAVLHHATAREWEKGFYLKAGIEYGLPIMGSMGTEGSVGPDKTLFFDSLKINASFGKGLWASFNAGYFITPNCGIDMGVRIGVGNHSQDFPNTLPYTWDIQTLTKVKTPIMLNSSLAFRIPMDRFSITARPGVIIPLQTTLSQSVQAKYFDRFNAVDNEINTLAEITTRFNLGFSAAVGIEYKITERLCAALEVNAVALHVDTKERNVTFQELNGEDVTSQLSESEKTTHFEYKTGYLQKNILLAAPVSFSSIGARLGFTFYF